MFSTKKVFIAALVLFAAGSIAAITSANHSWDGYHWARTANPFTLKVGDNVSPAWDSYLDEAIADWSASSVLDLTKATGSTNPRACKPKAGRIEACSERYGNTGWLGLAQIWVSGLHITQAVTKVNDTYFNTSTYNKPEWRRLVMCQEIAHDFGLDHQNEKFDNLNLGTCMDYTNAPAGGVYNGFDYGPSNEHPNTHDFEEIEIIYAHITDSITTIRQTISGPGKSGKANGVGGEEMSDWGKSIRTSSDSRSSLFEKDLGGGHKVFTFVIWAD